MKIIVGKTAGFCYGVKNAIAKTEEELNEKGTVDCLGDLVHNKQVIRKLEKAGLHVIEDIEQARHKVIIRAHGVPKQVYQKAKENKVEIVDLTCPNVLKIHKIAEEYASKGYYLFFIAEKGHPETIGTASFCKPKYSVIEKEEELEKAIAAFKESGLKKAFIISQTTFNLEKFHQYCQYIQKELSHYLIEIKNTICNATRMRQEETTFLSKQVECMIIIGGKKSSNTQKLYDISCQNCTHVIKIETVKELEKANLGVYQTIGVMAGASTPEDSIQEVIEYLTKIE